MDANKLCELELFNDLSKIEYFVKTHNEIIEQRIQQKQFIDSFYESSLSHNYNKIKTHNAYNANKIINTCDYTTYEIPEVKKILTFIIAIKNRNIRTNICLQNLLDVTQKYSEMIDIMVVEELGNNNFMYKSKDNHKFKHIKVSMNSTSFNKSTLLNIGLKQATTKYVVTYDCDFLAYNIDKMINTLYYYFNENNLLFRCSLYETNDVFDNNNKKIRSQYDPYSYVWILNRYKLLEINGFNTSFDGWGFEETDVMTRLLTSGNKLIHIFQNFFHLSHNDNSRNKDNININRQLFKKQIIYPKNLHNLNNLQINQNICVFKFDENNEVFTDDNACIYNFGYDVILIDKELFKCTFICNIIDIEFSETLYETYQSIICLGFKSLPTWIKQTQIGVITPSFNTEIPLYENHLKSIQKQTNRNYIHITIDSNSEELLYSFMKFNLPNSFFITKRAKIVDAIQIGYKLLSKTTRYWMWLNSDDEFYDSQTINTMYDIIDNNSNVNIFYGEGVYKNYDTLKETDVFVNKHIEQQPYESFLLYVGIIQPSVYIQSNNKLIENCLFNVQESYVFDYEFWINLSQKPLLFKHIVNKLSKFIFSENNITCKHRQQQLKETVELIKRKYGFVPLKWITKYSDCIINNNTGIICNRNKLKPLCIKNEILKWIKHYCSDINSQNILNQLNTKRHPIIIKEINRILEILHRQMIQQ